MSPAAGAGHKRWEKPAETGTDCQRMPVKKHRIYAGFRENVSIEQKKIHNFEKNICKIRSFVLYYLT